MIWFQADIFVKHEMTRKAVMLSVVEPLHKELKSSGWVQKFHVLPYYFDIARGERARKLTVRFLIDERNFEAVESRLRELLGTIPEIVGTETERQNFAALKQQFGAGWSIMEDLLECGSLAALSLLGLHQHGFRPSEDSSRPNPFLGAVASYVDAYLHYFLFQLFHNRHEENDVYLRKIVTNVSIMARDSAEANRLLDYYRSRLGKFQPG